MHKRFLIQNFIRNLVLLTNPVLYYYSNNKFQNPAHSNSSHLSYLLHLDLLLSFTDLKLNFKLTFLTAIYKPLTKQQIWGVSITGQIPLKDSFTAKFFKFSFILIL